MTCDACGRTLKTVEVADKQYLTDIVELCMDCATAWVREPILWGAFREKRLRTVKGC